MYVEPNFRTKKALKDALKNGETVTAFQPGGLFPGATDGRAFVEGPHYPAPHTWYAEVELAGGVVVKVVS